MTDKTEQPYDKVIALIQRYPQRFVGLLMVIGIVWFVTDYRSNSFFTFEGITLGMTPKQVEQELPNAGKFQKIRVQDPTSGDVLEFGILETTENISPWSRLMVVSIDGKIASISARVSDVTPEEVDELRAMVISLYGGPDDILKSEFGRETLVWGDVTFKRKDIMQGVKEIDGRAILYRSNDSGTVNIYISRDGEGPNFFY